MNKNLLQLYFAAISIAVCLAGRVPVTRGKADGHHVKAHVSVDPLSARALLDNNFESGFEEPWYDSSPSTVHWVVEDFTTPFEVNYTAPAPLAGTKYLRAIRNEQLAAGLLILRTVTFTAYPGDEISFNFWIRSKYTGGNTLDLVMAIGETEQTLVSLTSYSTSVNLEWRPMSAPLPVSEPMDVTLIFYAFCGSNAEDAIALDDITFASPNAPTTPPTTTTTTTMATTLPPGVCGGTFIDPSGIISSPNYPQPYGFDEYCEYLIQVADGKRVVLDFLYFNTEGGADYVTVYDGLTTSSTVLIRASGFNDDLITTSGSNCLVVHSSDYQNSLTGWQATYRSL
ncbi:cubilin-like [Daphnia carinata]|uniref:cubilin-like n=1 Tax=Daphnia carinata TaxID=120202 RepID=UPI00257DBF1F|nr:cubilin-like [Daphnia carinata]